MQKIFIGIIIFLAVVLQVSLLPNFFSTGLVPDVALILVIVWTAKNGFDASLAKTISAGLLVDLFSFWPVGLSILSFLAVSFVVDSLSKRFLVPQTVRKMIIFISLILVGTWINYFLLTILMKIFVSIRNLPQNDFSIWNQAIIFKPLFNLLTLAAVYWPLEKLEHIFGQQNKMIIKR